MVRVPGAFHVGREADDERPVLIGLTLTSTHLVDSMFGIVREFSWSGCGEFMLWPGVGTPIVVFDHSDYIGTVRGWKNHQDTGGSCFLSGGYSVDPVVLVVALNTARVSDNPPVAAANVIQELLATSASKPNRWAEAAAVVVGGLHAIVGDPAGAAAIGVLALFCWSLTRIAPVKFAADGVQIARMKAPLRPFAPYLFGFAVSSIALGALLTILQSA